MRDFVIGWKSWPSILCNPDRAVRPRGHGAERVVRKILVPMGNKKGSFRMLSVSACNQLSPPKRPNGVTFRPLNALRAEGRQRASVRIRKQAALARFVPILGRGLESVYD